MMVSKHTVNDAALFVISRNCGLWVLLWLSGELGTNYGHMCTDETLDIRAVQV